ncbi:hypothetical protein BGW38_007075, partial [Lunasporangiospora selenospora]
MHSKLIILAPFVFAMVHVASGLVKIIAHNEDRLVTCENYSSNKWANKATVSYDLHTHAAEHCPCCNAVPDFD